MPMRILIPAPDITRRVRELGAEISNDYRGVSDVHLICVLKGAFLFLADLVRAIDVPLTIDFMALSSYGRGETSSGEVRLLKDLDSAIAGRHVLIVEDIVDTGLTLHYLREILAAREPKSVRTACLLDKPSHRRIDVAVEYIGFTIEDHFVVGFGLDHADHHRNLPHIAVLDLDDPQRSAS